jgi:hypothetical protein
MADTKVEKPKGPIGKLKDAMDDKEEQLAILSTFVRLGILIWSGGILTLNYVTIPGWEQDKIDPTFIASVFTGVTATFGVQAGGKKKSSNSDGAQISKKDMEALIEKASQSAPTQTIKLEVPAVKISS